MTWRNAPYQTRFGPGFYTEVAGHPLADSAALESYRAPEPDRDDLYADAARAIAAYKSEYYIVGVTVCTIFETAWALRGLEPMLADFVESPELADRILDIPFRYHLTAAKHLVEIGVDMIWTGDDVGAQHGMLISPRTWRRFLKPRMAEFYSTLKGINPALKIAYHSDGNIEPIIPELIEIGMDVLNPVQSSCPGMDPVSLKKEFGGAITFMGGLDTQELLPHSSADQVRRETARLIEAMTSEHGGYILAASHTIPPETPDENIFAMYAAAGISRQEIFDNAATYRARST